MTKPPSHLPQLACLEALPNQQQNLVETIGKLVEIIKSLPEGEARDRLLDKIDCLDAIADVIKRMQKAMEPEGKA